ncbi:MAG TPA: NHL repeat-containing protein [Blastocatellia bacterium]|nr:NHL repeat-containing protein [Blastocatellia bacterium]
MRRIVLAVLILVLPTATAIVVYLLASKSTPTNRLALGLVTTIAGSGAPGVVDGPALSAGFSDPFGLAVDKRGNVIVAEGGQSNRIRRVTTEGKVETIAGSSEGFADGNALQAQFNTPSGIAIDRAGNIIITDTSNNRIRKLSTDGTRVSTIAGNGIAGFTNGRTDEAQFDGPIGIAVDKNGNLFVADAYNDSIRKITTDGVVTTIAGTGSPGYSNGQANSAMFDTPCGVAVDEEGNVFVADTGNHAIRRISVLGEVATIAGDTEEGLQKGDVRLNHPVGIGLTHDGFLFVSDAERGRIIRITPEGDSAIYAGSIAGFANSTGESARFNGPSSVAVDRQGIVYVADSQNYLIREIVPSQTAPLPKEPRLFVQPADSPATKSEEVIPIVNAKVLGVGQTFPWPLSPQQNWHEIAGVVGEARGVPGGVPLDHLHAGLDIRGARGDRVFSVMDEKVSGPMSNWGFHEDSEGIRIGLMSYIHVYVGRTAIGPGREMTAVEAPERFKPRLDSQGALAGIRVRRGTRFKVGEFVGSLNWLNHVHLDLGPWNAQANPLVLPFFETKDKVAPTIESIEVVPAGELAARQPAEAASEPFKAKRVDHAVISGDVSIIVTAYDRMDGNGANRKLGLFRIGYQLLQADGTPVKGFEKPLMNIEFSRVLEDSSVTKVYAPGSGVSAYGTPTRFRYIVTNLVRDGEATEGLLRTSILAPGDYIIRVIAEDFAGNRPSDPSTDLAVTVRN